MSEKAEAIEAWIARARSGDRDQVDRLLERFRDDLLAVAEREVAEAGGGRSHASELTERTLVEAASQFTSFRGATVPELGIWLEGILVRCAGSLSDEEPATMPALRPPDSGAPSSETADPQIIERPPDQEEYPTFDTTKDAGGEVHQMDTLGAEHAPAGGPTAAGVVREFGDYELLDMIAKGGMGVVYKARQKKLNRVVALKMILAGQFADERDVERFYVEAEAAANLRHPNIVAVHEVGEAEGQHYFSMDYVAGQSLASLVRERPLSAQWAAELVKKIAEAVEFAHQHGILHRDMKPSNILLDKVGQPLITDFGLAKRVGGQSHLTLTGTVVGTPSYMPPEQAAGKSDEVGTESDVYSTGALLYELLTGTPPFRAATPMETLQQVLHNEPPSPRLLNPSVPADLETICLKCLQKEGNRRYQTSQQLADELGRYLAGEPILARPVSRPERVVRWCRRNPRIAGLSAPLAFALLFAGVTFVDSSFKTSAALKTAEMRLTQALRSVDELFTLVSDEELLNEPGMQPFRKRLLGKARDLYKDMLTQEVDDPAIRAELARSHFRLGRILAEVGSPQEALDAYGTALTMQEGLLEQQPDDSEVLGDLGNTRTAIGATLDTLKEDDEALAWHELALEARGRLVELHPERVSHRRKQANSSMNIGLLHKDLGRLDEARGFLEQAQTQRLEILRQDSTAAAEDSEIETVRRDLGMGYYNLGLIARSRQADAMARQQQDVAEQGLQDAVGSFQEAVDVFKELLLQRPKDLKNQCRLANCYRLLARATFESPDADAALLLCEKAREIIQPLADGSPDVHEYQAELAGIHHDLGAFLAANSPPDAAQAIASYTRALAILHPLVVAYPTVARYRCDLVATLRGIGLTELQVERLEDAAEHLQASLSHAEELLKQYPDNQQYALERDQTLFVIGHLPEQLKNERSP